MPHGNLRAILAQQGFRRLLAVRLSSQLGDGWFQAGLASSVFFNPEKAASPVAIAMAFAVLLVPYSTLGPFVGVFLDRWSRRKTGLQDWNEENLPCNTMISAAAPTSKTAAMILAAAVAEVWVCRWAAAGSASAR